MFHQQFRNEGCATLSSCRSWELVPGTSLTEVLNVLTAYTLRMMLYSD
jgi:hypothetical protein